MRLIGYWIRSLDDTDYVLPQELVGPLGGDTRRAVSDYLDRGREYEQYRGRSWCRCYCDREMGSRELSDGMWVWPEDLGHYVHDHGVLLPEEFVAHALSGTSPLPKSQWAPIGELDHEFWKQWCRTHRSGEYRVRLDESRQRADEEARRLFEVAVTELEAKEGLSPDSCQWVGCTNRALSGRALCPGCTMRTPNPLRCPAHYDLASVLDA